MNAAQLTRFRVLDADGNLIVGGVTRDTANFLDVLEAIQCLEEDPSKQQERTPDGWTVERE